MTKADLNPPDDGPFATEFRRRQNIFLALMGLFLSAPLIYIALWQLGVAPELPRAMGFVLTFCALLAVVCAWAYFYRCPNCVLTLRPQIGRHWRCPFCNVSLHPGNQKSEPLSEDDIVSRYQGQVFVYRCLQWGSITLFIVWALTTLFALWRGWPFGPMFVSNRVFGSVLVIAVLGGIISRVIRKCPRCGHTAEQPVCLCSKCKQNASLDYAPITDAGHQRGFCPNCEARLI